MVIQIKRRFKMRFPILSLGSSRRLSRRIPEFETDPVEPVLASTPGLVGGTARSAGTTSRGRRENQRGEHQQVRPGSGVPMGNNPRQSSIQAGAPRIPSTLWDRNAELDASGKHEAKRRHVVRKRSAGGGARLRTNEGRPAGRTSASVLQ